MTVGELGALLGPFGFNEGDRVRLGEATKGLRVQRVSGLIPTIR